MMIDKALKEVYILNEEIRKLQLKRDKIIEQFRYNAFAVAYNDYFLAVKAGLEKEPKIVDQLREMSKTQ